jgi:arylsulfatase A-like enzyme
LLGKQSLYEHSMKCPLIMAGPGIPAGKSTDGFSYLFDLLPTIVEMAGIKPPGNLAGESLRPLWVGEKKIRDSVFLPYSDLMRSVRDERWKLIVYPPINYQELFDLKTDPHEARNLAADKAHAAKLKRLTSLMKDWQKKVRDPHPLTVERPRSKEVSFDGFERKPDQWQPKWIVEKYFNKK